MFVRLKRSGSPGALREYLQIVESFREQGKVRQRLIATLGRRDELATGALDDLIRSLTKFSEQLRVVERVRHDGLHAHIARAWGPALVFGRLWEQQGLPALLARPARGRRFGFDLERACFALALQRLCAPGSDLQGVGWLRTVECPGVEELELQHLYRAPFDYILGCRLRQDTTVTEEVLARAGRYHPVDGRTSLQVKDVQVGDQRYIVCRNLDEAKKDAAARAAILAKLEHTLAHAGPKAVIGNTGFKRFVTVAKGSVAIDRAAVERDARLDGKFVLRTTTALSAEEVARAYKSLWRVERAFRETKSTFEVRPIFHHRDDTSTGHIVACFLALRLEVDLQRRLADRQVDVSWPDLMRDLTEVRAVDLTLDGPHYRLRTDLRGSAYHAFAAAGVRPPALVTPLGPAPTASPPSAAVDDSRAARR